jgi:hypothetical protein
MRFPEGMSLWGVSQVLNWRSLVTVVEECFYREAQNLYDARDDLKGGLNTKRGVPSWRIAASQLRAGQNVYGTNLASRSRPRCVMLLSLASLFLTP